ncbi:MAG: hypothetical protein LCH53_10390 [Bacteroidetes bacterium]|nr:hypothetical protein [Bacteroidota bacterium]
MSTKNHLSVSFSEADNNLLLDDDLPEAVRLAAQTLAQVLADRFELIGGSADLTLAFDVSGDDEVSDLYLAFDEA